MLFFVIPRVFDVMNPSVDKKEVIYECFETANPRNEHQY